MFSLSLHILILQERSPFIPLAVFSSVPTPTSAMMNSWSMTSAPINALVQKVLKLLSIQPYLPFMISAMTPKT
ncbi:MAG: hypothetical protein V7K41_01675 [Nostoc sp.]